MEFSSVQRIALLILQISLALGGDFYLVGLKRSMLQHESRVAQWPETWLSICKSNGRSRVALQDLHRSK